MAKAQIVANPQLSLLLYECEANIILNILQNYIPINDTEQKILTSIITELNKINNIKINV